MIWPANPRAGRLLGQGLLTGANVITVTAALAAGWNDSHIFNDRLRAAIWTTRTACP